ncbi:MAG TPA: hypothetical protein VIC71_03920 [Gammaproteobacteria bacterium]|jgi:hypothetical protein
MMRALLAMIGAAAGLVGSARAADEPPAPELDFLEYLGSWQAEDEEWVIEAGWEDDEEVAPPADGKQGAETGTDAEPEGANDEA